MSGFMARNRTAWRRFREAADRAAGGGFEVSELLRAHRAANAARFPSTDPAEAKAAADLLKTVEAWLRSPVGARSEIAVRMAGLCLEVEAALDASVPQARPRADVDG